MQQETTQTQAQPQTSGSPTRRFVDKLLAAERTLDPSELLDLFSPSPELKRMIVETHQSGKVDTRTFWTTYLDAFSEIRSHFTNITESDRVSFLEWTSEGSLKGGQPFRYCGVSVLEFGEHGKIEKFRTYYDSAAFTQTRH